MNVKKSLEHRIKGWLPKEPVLKTPLKAKIVPVNRSLSFRVRRWLYGSSAFLKALLWCQRSRKFKTLAVAMGVFVLSEFLFLLVASNLLNSYWFEIGSLTLLWGYLGLQLGLIRYFEGKEPRKNQPVESMKPNQKLWSTIIIVIGAAMMISTLVLGFYDDYLLYNSPFIVLPFYLGVFPYYLGLFGLFMILLGWWLSREWRKRNKLSPS